MLHYLRCILLLYASLSELHNRKKKNNTSRHVQGTILLHSSRFTKNHHVVRLSAQTLVVFIPSRFETHCPLVFYKSLSEQCIKQEWKRWGTPNQCRPPTPTHRGGGGDPTPSGGEGAGGHESCNIYIYIYGSMPLIMTRD